MYIYKRIVVFFSLQHGLEYTKTLFVEEKRFTCSSVFLPSVYVTLARSLARSLSLSLSSLTLQSRICILKLCTRSYSLNVEGGLGFIYIFFIAFLFTENQLRIIGSLSAFARIFPLSLSESLLSFVSALLVRCGSALLINLILALRSLAILP